MNSWNRMPFKTSLVHGYPSYDVLYTNVHSNFIIANYGGSQAFDTDDGSAWYNIYDNVCVYFCFFFFFYGHLSRIHVYLCSSLSNYSFSTMLWGTRMIMEVCYVI